jgi:two-component system, NarL family, response regulator LiaR
MNRRILLVDDHGLVRSGLKALIADFPGFEVVGEAADGAEALLRIEALQPDIVVMDMSMPRLNGLEATARILAAQPHCKVVMLSMHAAAHYVDEALRAGACGYLMKEAAPEELERALNAVARGERFLSPRLRPPGAGPAAPAAAADATLTARQREVLRLIAEGCSTRDIAARLYISVKTVETHRAQIMQRLGIFDVAGLTRHAIRTGLVSPEG